MPRPRKRQRNNYLIQRFDADSVCVSRGAVEAIATILTIDNGMIPPTINHFTDDPEIPALDFTFNQAKRREVNFALSNAFGFGGHNVCLAFRKY